MESPSVWGPTSPDRIPSFQGGVPYSGGDGLSQSDRAVERFPADCSSDRGSRYDRQINFTKRSTGTPGSPTEPVQATQVVPRRCTLFPRRDDRGLRNVVVLNPPSSPPTLIFSVGPNKGKKDRLTETFTLRWKDPESKGLTFHP